MCLYPKLIKNPKYKANRKNGGVIPTISDIRVTRVPIGCGKCMECEKQKRNEWKTRLMEDIKVNTKGKFITLTFNNVSYRELAKEFNTTGYDLDNCIATIAVRRFLERWRKKHKKSLRHWLVTELGQNNTEHLHIHGIVWTENLEDVRELWKYGYVWIGKTENEKLVNWVDERTVNYITKYLTKKDEKHKEYKPIMLTSPGIGGNYITSYNARLNKFKGENTKESYTDRSGFQTGLPIYWRNKIYDDEQREWLWLNRLNKNERWINGNKIDVSNGYEEYFNAVKEARKINKELGYGDDSINWDRKRYEEEMREIKQAERLLAEMDKKSKEYELELRMKEAKQDFASTAGGPGFYRILVPPTPKGEENGDAKLFIDTDL